MAIFNPTVDENQPNFLGYSRGTTPDTAVAGIVHDASNILEADIKAGVKYYDRKIEKEARERTQPIQDAYQQLLSSPLGNTADADPTPLDLTRRLDRTTSMQDAVRSGKMRESHYRNLLDAEARAMRANYPGFQDVVDQHIARLTGGNPANQMIQELFQEAKQGQGAANKENEYWIHQANQQGVIPDYEARAKAGTPLSMSEIRERVTIKHAQDANIARSKQKIELAKAAGEEVKEATKTVFGKELQNMTTLMFRAAVGPADDVRKAIKEIEATRGPAGDMDPKQREILLRSIGQLERSFDDMAWGVVSRADKTTDKDGNEVLSRYSDVLKEKGDVQGIIDNAKAPLVAVKEAIFNKDYGTIGSIIHRMEWNEKDDQNRLTATNESIRLLQAIKNGLGHQWTALELFRSSELLKGISQVMNEDHKLRALTGPEKQGDPPPSIKEDFKTRQGQKVTDPALYRASINDTVKMLGNTSLSGPALAHVTEKVGEYLYGDANKDFLAARDKDGNLVMNFKDSYGVYLKMAGDPAVAQNMLKIKESNPKTYANYSSWVKGNFETMMKIAANDASDVNADGMAGKVEWNPDTLSFSLVPRVSDKGFETRYNAAKLDRKAGDSVKNINKVLLGVSTLIKAEGGNPVEELPKMMLKLGITPPNDNPKSLWNSMFGTPQAATSKPSYVELIKGFEGFSPEAKYDFKQYSVGYGRKGVAGEKAGTPIQEEQKLIAAAKPVVDWIDNNISIPLSPRQRDSLVSFGYNLGTGALDKLKDDINAGKLSAVAMRMSTFNRAGGEIQPGLTSRRAREARPFLQDPFFEGATASNPDGKQIQYRNGSWQPLE